MGTMDADEWALMDVGRVDEGERRELAVDGGGRWVYKDRQARVVMVASIASLRSEVVHGRCLKQASVDCYLSGYSIFFLRLVQSRVT